MQVALGDVLTVLARELIERLGAVALLVVPVCGLDFPIMDDVGVRVAGGGVAIAEGERWLLQRLERILQQRALLDLLDGVGDLAVFGIRVLRGLVKELSKKSELSLAYSGSCRHPVSPLVAEPE